MGKIAFIASDRHLYTLGREVIREIGLEDSVDIYFARLNRAVRLVQALDNTEVDAIVARGGTARLIEKSSNKIPVIEIVMMGLDLAHILNEAKKITGSANPRVAFIAFENIIPDLEALAEGFGFNIKAFRVNGPREIPALVEKICQSDFDVLVGGKKTITLAQARGMKCIMLWSGFYSLKQAILKARNISDGRKIEKENTEKFKALIDCSMEGIVSIDKDKTITVFNPAAARLLDIAPLNATGKNIDSIFSIPNINRIMSEGGPVENQLLRHGNTWLNTNIQPILVDGTAIGAFITFQDVSHIQEAEAKFRNEVVARKFYAKYTFPEILGHSPQMVETKRMAGEMAKVDATILIMGESGTGKELFAQSIHNASARQNGPFVAINCAALPPNLLESELFGYVEGAFTGATRKGRAGLFEMAHKGTIFLDEISEMDKSAQGRLLRVLQERQVMRLGDNKYIPIDVRVITATNRDLYEMCSDNAFRFDLFYRLNVLSFTLPALRQRTGDVSLLASHFLNNFNRQYHKQVQISPEAYRVLETCRWPGNIRELLHFIERLTIISSHDLVTDEAIARYLPSAACSPTVIAETTATPADDLIARSEEEENIISALKETNSNIKLAAKILGMARSTLYRKLKEYQIEAKKSY